MLESLLVKLGWRFDEPPLHTYGNLFCKEIYVRKLIVALAQNLHGRTLKKTSTFLDGKKIMMSIGIYATVINAVIRHAIFINYLTTRRPPYPNACTCAIEYHHKCTKSPYDSSHPCPWLKSHAFRFRTLCMGKKSCSISSRSP